MGSVSFPLVTTFAKEPSATCDPALRRRMATMERRLLRGDFKGFEAFYETVSMDSRCYLVVARLTMLGAIGSGNTALFSRVLDDVRAYPRRCGLPLAQLAVDLTQVWLRQFLSVPDGYPDWLLDGSMRGVPVEWRLMTCYLMVKMFLVRRDYVKAQATAQIALYLVPERMLSPAAATYLKLVLALSMQGQGRVEESLPLFRDAVKGAAEQRAALPFLDLAMGTKSALYTALKEEAPALLRKVKTLSPDFFRNKVRFHNLFTGAQFTELLSPREFFVASSLWHGSRYKEIADRLGVEVSGVNGITKSIYSKLGIHGFPELAGKVW